MSASEGADPLIFHHLCDKIINILFFAASVGCGGGLQEGEDQAGELRPVLGHHLYLKQIISVNMFNDIINKINQVSSRQDEHHLIQCRGQS